MSRRFRRRPSSRLLFTVALLFIIFARYGWDQLRHRPRPESSFLVEGPCTIVRVVDGDTLIVRQNANAGEQVARLRLLGIDCPEAARPDRPPEPWSAQATEFTRAFVSNGDSRLRLDRRRLDQYDRCLGYLLVDGRMLNLELVQAGLARVEAYPGDSPSITRRLRRAEGDARASVRRTLASAA